MISQEPISVEEAQEIILQGLGVLLPEEKPILEALGQVLAEDIASTVDVPPADNSAMDGYALRAEDAIGATAASPRRLEVLGQAPAGHTFPGSITPGTAVRITTGAPIPPGADTVVRFEDTDDGYATGWVAVYQEAKEGQNIRRAGEDIPKGKRLLPTGTILGPVEIGVLASLGRAKVKVVRRPRVAVLSTGDELVGPGRPLAAGQIYDINSYAIAAQVFRCGGLPIILGIARDTMESLVGKLRQAHGTNLFITSGGVSAGEFDLVKKVLALEGRMTFWQVRMRPGRPLAFGHLGGIPHIGLPGNPVASMVAFELFARPAILKMGGKTQLYRLQVEAIFADEIENGDGRRNYLRVQVYREGGQFYAKLSGSQGAGVLSAMIHANGLAVIPDGVTQARPGDKLKVLMIDEPEEEGLWRY